ncbi:MAG: Histidine kinase-, DNA gyrase B-, and HSP90-like ATPase [Halonotius sp. J07HN6]|nr:MAG: Histidine kinase-, DNA gyrase B-, and HSP90-like ATPase [Halonotius sp. J07HN6]
MTVAIVTLLAIVTGVVSFGYILFGGFLLRRYGGIGVRSLSLFSVLWGAKFVLGSVAFYILARNGVTNGASARLATIDTPLVNLLRNFEPTLVALLTVSGIFVWFWFILRYTRRIGRREKLAVAAVGGGTFVLRTLAGVAGAASGSELLFIRTARFIRFVGVIEILGTGVAVGVGIALLYSTASNHQPFSERAVVGLTLPLVPLWIVGYLYRFNVVTEFQLVSALRIIALAVGLVGLWLTVTDHDLFEQLPASRSVGRQTAFNSSDTAIIVVNNDDNVSDLNPAACDLFSVSSADCVGESLASLLPTSVTADELRQPEATTFEMPDSDTMVEAATTTSTDDSGQSIGETIVLSDITDERRRQQRIQVLNRVLRHNLRNDLNAAKGYVGVMADGGTDTERFQTKVESILDDLVTIGNKAQSTEQVLEADPIANDTTPVSVIVADAVESVESELGSVETEISVPGSPAVRINPEVIHSVVEEVVQNAVRHADDAAVTITYDADPPALTIADDGPGIPDHEIAVLENAQETDLEHGSGLGLWLIKWGTESFGGTVTFDTYEGTAVRIEFPSSLVEDESADS